MGEKETLHAIVHGIVQGVNFRSFVIRHARELGLSGYVRNILLAGTVEVVAEGEREKLEGLLGYLEMGPRGAWVERVEVKWSEYKGAYSSFEVIF